MNKKQIVRLNEGQLKRVVAETVKYMLKEYYENDSYDGQLTVGELINELQKCDPNERVEIYVGNGTFNCITNVYGCYLFKNGMEYKEWKQREEEAEKNYKEPYREEGNYWDNLYGNWNDRLAMGNDYDD